MSGSQRRHSVPEVARILGISERGVRDKIERGQLDAVKEGKRWMVFLPPEQPAAPPEDDAVVSGSPRGSNAVVDAVVTPAQIEQAIERTGQKYVTDMAALYDRISAELGQVYAGQLAAKDEALAAKDETIAELRRRAEAAEAALARRHAEEARAVELLRRRNEQEWLNRERMQAAEDGPGATAAPTRDNPGGAASAGFWTRVRRVFGGGGDGE